MKVSTSLLDKILFTKNSKFAFRILHCKWLIEVLIMTEILIILSDWSRMSFWINSIILLLADSTLKLVTTAKESRFNSQKDSSDLFFSEENLSELPHVGTWRGFPKVTHSWFRGSFRQGLLWNGRGDLMCGF